MTRDYWAQCRGMVDNQPFYWDRLIPAESISEAHEVANIITRSKYPDADSMELTVAVTEDHHDFGLCMPDAKWPLELDDPDDIGPGRN